MDFGLELDIYVQLKARRWKCGEKGEWYEFIQSKEDSSTAILAECAGLSELNLSQSEIIHEMVKWLISKPSEYLPTTHLTEHHLELTDYIPIRYHHRCRSPAMWKIASEAVQEMHRAAVIKTSASDWCHAPVIQHKSDGSHRFCIDFRDLNLRSKKDAYRVYALPNMDSILDKFRRAKFISKVDLKQAYFQIPLHGEKFLGVTTPTPVVTVGNLV